MILHCKKTVKQAEICVAKCTMWGILLCDTIKFAPWICNLTVRTNE